MCVFVRELGHPMLVWRRSLNRKAHETQDHPAACHEPCTQVPHIIRHNRPAIGLGGVEVDGDGPNREPTDNKNETHKKVVLNERKCSSTLRFGFGFGATPGSFWAVRRLKI